VADQAAPAAGDHRPLILTLVVVSGAPGTGKSTIASAVGAALRFPVLSLDPVKEALADVLGLSAERVLSRIGHGRHPIHRDMISPVIGGDIASLVATVTPLGLGGRALIDVDTGPPGASGRTIEALRAALTSGS